MACSVPTLPEVLLRCCVESSCHAVWLWLSEVHNAESATALMALVGTVMLLAKPEDTEDCLQ